jgi:predicted O-methyltransferase YrrM
MMNRAVQSVAEFKTRVADLIANPKFMRKSTLSIRDGAGVIERVLGEGNYRRVLEIGTFRGVNAAFMSQFVDRVITVDLKSGLLEHNGEDFDRRAFWDSLGIDNIDLHLVENDAEKARVCASERYDFAFIDGDHEGRAPALDFKLVRGCGTVLFHDYGAANGVTRLVDTLPRQQVEIIDIFALWKA